MKFCTGCGRQLPENVKFCPGCGKVIREAPAASKAPQPPPVQAAPASAPPAPARKPEKPKKRVWAVLVPVVVLLLIGGGLLLWHFRPGAESSEPALPQVESLVVYDTFSYWLVQPDGSHHTITTLYDYGSPVRLSNGMFRVRVNTQVQGQPDSYTPPFDCYFLSDGTPLTHDTEMRYIWFVPLEQWVDCMAYAQYVQGNRLYYQPEENGRQFVEEYEINEDGAYPTMRCFYTDAPNTPVSIGKVGPYGLEQVVHYDEYGNIVSGWERTYREIPVGSVEVQEPELRLPELTDTISLLTHTVMTLPNSDGDGGSHTRDVYHYDSMKELVPGVYAVRGTRTRDEKQIPILQLYSADGLQFWSSAETNLYAPLTWKGVEEAARTDPNVTRVEGNTVYSVRPNSDEKIEAEYLCDDSGRICSITQTFYSGDDPEDYTVIVQELDDFCRTRQLTVTDHPTEEPYTYRIDFFYEEFSIAELKQS